MIPENVVKSDLDRAKPFRGSIDDMFHPEAASSEPSVVQEKAKLSKERGRQTDFERTKLEKDRGRSSCSEEARR